MSADGKTWSSEEKKVKAKFQPWILRLLPFSVAFMAVFPYLVLTGAIDLCPNVKSDSLANFTSKLEFTLRFMSLGVFWMEMVLTFWENKKCQEKM